MAVFSLSYDFQRFASQIQGSNIGIFFFFQHSQLFGFWSNGFPYFWGSSIWLLVALVSSGTLRTTDFCVPGLNFHRCFFFNRQFAADRQHDVCTSSNWLMLMVNWTIKGKRVTKKPAVRLHAEDMLPAVSFMIWTHVLCLAYAMRPAPSFAEFDAKRSLARPGFRPR